MAIYMAPQLETREVTLTGIGPSQWPLCNDGDQITYLPTKSLRFSDLGVYRVGVTTVCHRVIATRTDGGRSYLMKGDSRLNDDGWIAEEAIVGRVVRVNNRRIDRLAPRVFARSIGLLNYLGYRLDQVFFETWIGQIRGHLTTYPIFEKLFPFAVKPWLIVAPSTRRQFWNVLKDGFLGSRFNLWWHPPKDEGRRMRRHSGDYGHAYYYDELFTGGNAEVSSVCDAVGTAGFVLDIGGGSGRLAEKLVYGGSRVTLLDNSETMVNKAFERARRMPTRLKGRLGVVHGGVEQMVFDERFDTAISLNNAFEHLTSWFAVEQALGKVRLALKPGGRLYVDVHNIEHWHRLPFWGRWRWLDEGSRQLPEGPERLWSRTRLTGNRLTWDHAVGRREFTLCRTSLLWGTRSQWEAAILANDFRIEAVWGNWDRVSLDHPDARKLIFCCRKLVSRDGSQSYSI
ncbi:MAG: methyltransferase domain-containing protein [Deltaproteobacteria bacterium]|nr:methyltransferase domain-containing protein [Deltaproteobacteria bacterium]